MNKLIEKIFERRGYTEEFLNSIDDPTHNDLMNVNELSAELYNCYTSGDRVVVLPDFDMDGIMSGVIGYAGLSELGFNTALFIPNPSDGYGFTTKTIDKLRSEYPDVKAILTCDVGTSCHEAIAYAQLNDIKVLVTDHHQPNNDSVLADVIVNPMMPYETYKHPDICGAYVLYQCLMNYTKLYQPKTLNNINRLCVFAGIATVSDMMPVLYENRKLVTDSITVCKLIFGEKEWFSSSLVASEPYKRAFRGLYYALNIHAREGKISVWNDIDEMFFGFYLVPMFNSIKRMDEDMTLGFGSFFGMNPESDIKKLYDLNQKRKILVDEHIKSIQEQDNPYAPFIYLSDASSGFLGLLANKLSQITGLPTIVLNRKSLKGSGRSPDWYKALTRLQSKDFWCAGHQGAFGTSVKSNDELPLLFEFLKNDSSEIYNSIKDELSTSKYDYYISTIGDDCDTNIDIQLFKDYIYNINKYKPFGIGFELPVGLIKFHASEVGWNVMGSSNQHVKMILPYGFEVICWNSGHLLSKLQFSNDFITVVGRLGISYFNDNYTVNFVGDFQLERGVE